MRRSKRLKAAAKTYVLPKKMSSFDEESASDLDLDEFDDEEHSAPSPSSGLDGHQRFDRYHDHLDSVSSFWTEPGQGSHQSVDDDDDQNTPVSTAAQESPGGSPGLPRGLAEAAKQAGRTGGAPLSKRRRSSKQECFIEKLYRVFGFSDDGSYIELRNAAGLAQVLNRYFKHSNTSSFIRQLNNYGFKTMSTMATGKNIQCFIHPEFKRDSPENVEKITRKAAKVLKKCKREIIKDLQSGEAACRKRIKELEELNQRLEAKVRRLERENSVHARDLSEVGRQRQLKAAMSSSEQQQHLEILRNVTPQVPGLVPNSSLSSVCTLGGSGSEESDWIISGGASNFIPPPPPHHVLNNCTDMTTLHHLPSAGLHNSNAGNMFRFDPFLETIGSCNATPSASHHELEMDISRQQSPVSEDRLSDPSQLGTSASALAFEWTNKEDMFVDGMVNSRLGFDETDITRQA